MRWGIRAKARTDSGVSDVATDRLKRPTAYEPERCVWNMQHIPYELPDGKPHPMRKRAVYVVHGMGKQYATETSALLRAGFEDAFTDIYAWQEKNRVAVDMYQEPVDCLFSPFVYDGFWGNYDDIEKSFPKESSRFNERERSFFAALWKARVISGSSTVWWSVRNIWRLLGPSARVPFHDWLLYLLLQPVSWAVLGFAYLRNREFVTGFLNDVRLYLDPQGEVEKAIVQQIDRRVRDEFMRMIGLDSEFRRLPRHKLIPAAGDRLEFDRVVWVAHSLGSVVSYNVISGLFNRAEEIEVDPAADAEQKRGVERFRSALQCFVTLGSPLDKAAFLLREVAVTPWPKGCAEEMAGGADEPEGATDTGSDWWVNFRHVLDPVSGALGEALICSAIKPRNIHPKRLWLPGLAHTAYWRDPQMLRFILGRTYGKRYLLDKQYRPWPQTGFGNWALSAAGYGSWALILIGGVWAIVAWGPDLLKGALAAVLP